MAKKKANRKSYPGHLTQRGAGWRWEVWITGQRHRIQLKARTRKEAEEMARDEYTKLLAAAKRYDAGAPAPVRMSELFAEFEELDMALLANGAREAYEDSLKVLRAHFVELRGDPRADRVYGPDVQRFLDWRRTHTVRKTRRKVSARTVAKDRAVLHRIFNRGERRGYVQGNPVAMTDVPKGDGFEPVILTDDEFEKLLGACSNPMLKTYLLLLGETGMRCESEALWLRWDDVNLTDGFIAVKSIRGAHRTKAGKSRHVPMTLRLQVAMREHVAAYKDMEYNGLPAPWVFHHLLTRRHHTAGERVKTFYDGFKGAAKRAGLSPAVRPHDLRHRRVTTWITEGRDVALIKEGVGHADLRTTMAYTHLTKEHLRALVEEPRPAPARPVLHRSSET